MKRLFLPFVLTVILVYLSIELVVCQNQVRKTFGQIQRLERERLVIEAEWGRWQIQRSSMLASDLIRTKAAVNLEMELPKQGQILFIER